jgi:hypothetical protein
MREICTSGSVGGEDGNSLAYPALSAPMGARAHASLSIVRIKAM